MFLINKRCKKSYFRVFPAWKKNRKSTSGEMWRAKTRLNLQQFDVSNMPVAKLKQIWQPNSVFWKNDCTWRYKQKFFWNFEIFLVQSTRLGKPEKTALADFIRFSALKKVFWNHHNRRIQGFILEIFFVKDYSVDCVSIGCFYYLKIFW